MGKRIIKICECCGKKFSIMPCRLRNGNGKCCSKKCRIAKAISKGKWYPVKNYKRIHIAVMENMIGRKLHKGEVVHHEDENKRNSDPSNLKLFASHSEHRKYHDRKSKIAQGIDPDIEKRCYRCKQIKPFSAFTKTVNRKGQKVPASACKPCAVIAAQIRYRAKKEKAS